MDSLIAEAQEALRDCGDLPLRNLPGDSEAPVDTTSTRSSGKAFVHQSSLALFRDAVTSAAPFAAESMFTGQLELHREASVEAAAAKAGVERQRDRIGVLSESIARANDEAAVLRSELSGLVQELVKVSATVNPALPESLSVTVPSTGETIRVTSEVEAREVIAAQVLEASLAITEAFRLRNETDAAHTAGEQLARESAELESVLSAQRASRVPPAQTDASKLNEAAQYYRRLGGILAECCELSASAAAETATSATLPAGPQAQAPFARRF